MRLAARLIALLALPLLPCSLAAQEFTFSDSGATAAKADDANTSFALRLRAAQDRQLEVYLDGVRVGLTPQEMRIRAGEYVLTASAEGVRPVIHPLRIEPSPETIDLVLPVFPMTDTALPAVRADLRSAWEKSKGNGHLMAILAMISTDKKDVDDLIAKAEKVLTGNNPTISLIKSRWMLVDKRAEDALAIVDSALAKEPNNVQLLRQKARICAVLERNKEAVAAADEAVRIDPQDWQSYHVRGICRRESDDRAGAREDLERALLLSENNQMVRATLEALLKPQLPKKQ